MQAIFPVEGSPEIHLDVLKSICGDASTLSMLDLGCGFAPQTRQLGFRSRTYVDVVERDLGEEMPYFINCGISSNEYFKTTKYDVCFALDVIEHFHKEAGEYLKFLMGKMAHKQIVFTPLGEYLVGVGDEDSHDTHRSGWLPDEFQGWASIIFPNFHPTLNIGAFFSFHCDNTETEFYRILTELESKLWAK